MSKKKEVQEIIKLLDSLGIDFNKNEFNKYNFTEKEVRQAKEGLLKIMSNLDNEYNRNFIQAMKETNFYPLFPENRLKKEI